MEFKNLKYALCSEVFIEEYKGDNNFNDTLYHGHSLDLPKDFDSYNVLSVVPRDGLLMIVLESKNEN